MWDGFWMLAGTVFTLAGIGAATGVVKTKPSETVLMTLILLASGLGAMFYSWRLMDTRKKARPVRDANKS